MALGEAWTPRPERPLVLGHRGARHALPENTLAAFQLALDEGADGVELDVRLAADGEPVVCHDATLARVTRGRDDRRVRGLSSDECERVDLGHGQGVPRLSRVLAWAAERRALVNVEIKAEGVVDPALVRRVAELCSQFGGDGRLLVSSFSAPAVCAHAWLAPGVPTAWLFSSRAAAWLTATRKLLAAAVHPREALVTAERVGRWQRRELRVHVWTVNDAARARALAGLGVDCLISDRPGAVLEALARGEPEG